MFSYHDIKIEEIYLSKVGNKLRNEIVKTSAEPLEADENLLELLKKYFLSPFKSEAYFTFYHSSSLKLNEVYSYVSSIFESAENLREQTVNLSKFLYEQSVHPRIRGGEFYVVHFRDFLINGEQVEAVGLFKSENKDTFLKFSLDEEDENWDIETDEGVNIKKLDKGCIVFNTEKENGYIVAAIDNTNKGGDAQYWMDDFLQLVRREDDYFNTEATMSMYKSYVTEHLPERFEMNRVDQADLLNRSMEYFKENEDFDIDNFSNEVIQQPDMIEHFNDYKSDYEMEREMNLDEHFEISKPAVKKQNGNYKSVIKLDKNFHIYVHGDRSKIEQSEDGKGKYYKIYFDEEN